MTLITTSTSSTATAYSNQRKIDRTSNGALWAHYWNGASGGSAGGGTIAHMRFAYSTDEGITWTDLTTNGFVFDGNLTSYTPNASFFIDLDDYAHIVYKDHSSGYIYYRRGTPNAGRTAWTWSSALLISDQTAVNYPDVVACRSATSGEWDAFIVAGVGSSPYSAVVYKRVHITAAGSFSTSVDGATAGYGMGMLYYWSSAPGGIPNTYPSIDFNHTGDGKTVAGGTPHLYVAWSAGATGAGGGIRFKKATYSGGSWTWGTEREIDSTRYVHAPAGWLNCLFDGTRVALVGSLYDGSLWDVMQYDRDAADTTTTTRELIANQSNSGGTASERYSYGSASYDSAGNVYFAGYRYVTEARLSYRKWTRAGSSLGSPVDVDTTGLGAMYVSAKRGYSNDHIEFIYTDGTASPYNIEYGSISLNALPDAPTDLTAGAVQGTNLPLTWTHNDPDNNPQSKYKFRWRKVIQ